MLDSTASQVYSVLLLNDAVKGEGRATLQCWYAATEGRQSKTNHSKKTSFGTNWRSSSQSCCVSVQALHPLKDPTFEVFEGESFRETLLSATGRSGLWSISRFTLKS